MEGGLSLKEAASVELEPSQREQAASAPAIDGFTTTFSVTLVNCNLEFLEGGTSCT